MNYKLLAKSIGIGVGIVILFIIAAVLLALMYNFTGVLPGIILLILAGLGIIVIIASQYYKENK